jgi:hypothetical protein
MMPSSNSTSKDGVQCWVAAGDIDIRRQSFTARRATPAFFLAPFSAETPKTTLPDLIVDIREGLEELFDRPECCAPFIPGYMNKDDAIARAEQLRDLGREVSDIILVRLTSCSPRVGYHRLDRYARDVEYQGAGLDLETDKVLILCEPFTKDNVVEWVEFDD